MIYKRILDYCQKERIPISEFERRCKIGNGTIGRWREDKSQPSLNTLDKISKSTGISISYWIGGEHE